MALLDPKATELIVNVPDSLTRRQRLELGDLIIEHIYDRTNRGLDKNNRKFKPYSKDYVDSLAGKIGGKRLGGKVDLQLSGDMLAAMEILETSEGKIKIGWNDDTEREKAEGNILGSYGADSPRPSKARDFLGIKASKLRELIDAIE